MIRFVILTFLFLTCNPCKAQEATEYANIAIKKIEKEDYQYALAMIDKAIAINDTNQWFYLIKADIELKLYGSRQALKTTFKAISINRKHAEPYSRAGRLYVSQNLTDSAIYMFNLAVKYASNDTLRNMYIMNRGTAKQSTRDFEGAKADFEKALQFNPDDIAVLNNLAGVYAMLNRKLQAISYLKKVVSLDPTFTQPLVNLGFIYSEMDSLDLALQYFDKILSIKPKDALLYNNIGYVYYKKGDYSTALKNINYSISLYPANSYAYRNLALVYIATGKKTETCDALRFAVSYDFRTNYGNEVDELVKKHCK